MKRQVLIQDCQTKLFLNSVNEWIADPDKARDFERTLMAISYWLNNKLQNAQLLVKDGQFGLADIVVPISSECVEAR